MVLEFFDKIEELISLLKQEEDNMRKAAHVVAQSIMSGGILQAFGSGHSASIAVEICGRAGGPIPSKQVRELSGGHPGRCSTSQGALTGVRALLFPVVLERRRL